jgi:hypothetical protein
MFHNELQFLPLLIYRRLMQHLCNQRLLISYDHILGTMFISLATQCRCGRAYYLTKVLSGNCIFM